jgi:hypothetical protein
MKALTVRATLLVILLVLLVWNAAQPTAAFAANNYVLPPPSKCVGIASDSNGFGQVTFQLPPAPNGQVGIIFVRPLDVVLRPELDALGLNDLAVTNRSLTAGSLTASERTNYLRSSPFASLIADRCKFNIVGPFIPDVAANSATPEQYLAGMVPLVRGLLDKNPQAVIFVLSHYYTARADFTATNNGFGLTTDHIDAFNAKLMEECKPTGSLGRIPQVICIDTQSFFSDMGPLYLLTSATRDEFNALVYRPTGFRPVVEQFFVEHPDGVLIGDGIHLSLAGRIRLMQRMAQIISRMSDF